MYKDFFKYIFALLLFGSNGIVANYINLNSYEIVFLRTLIGSFLLIIICFMSREKLTFWKHKKDFVFLAISGIAMGTSWMFLYEAYAQIGVSIASLCYYCGPVIVMILSPLLFREELTSAKIIGFLSVLIGIFFVDGQGAVSANHCGLMCGLASAVMYAFMVIFNKKAIAVTGLENSTLQLSVGFVTVAVFVGFKQGFMIDIPAESVFPIFVLGLLNTGIGCYLYFSSIGKIPVQTVAVCGYLEPLSAVLFSVIFLGEKLLLLQIVGTVLIIGGAIFGECVKTKRKTLTQ